MSSPSTSRTVSSVRNTTLGDAWTPSTRPSAKLRTAHDPVPALRLQHENGMLRSPTVRKISTARSLSSLSTRLALLSP